MERAEIRRATADERKALVADLRGLSPADWDRPSLCVRWAVRDVVGHLVRLDCIYRYSAPFFLGVARYGGRVNTYLREDARRYAATRSPEELLDALAATSYDTTITAKWHPIPAVPLSELIVHGQDVRRPLGLARRFETDRLEAVADLLRRRLGVFGRGGRPKGRFEATDAEWTCGKGETIRAPMEELVMRLAGRAV